MKPANRKVKFIEGNGGPLRSVKPGRNDPCKCGSGKKSKACCGSEAKFYYSIGKPTKSNFVEKIINDIE